MSNLVSVVSLVAAALVLTACGDDDNGNGGGLLDAATADAGEAVTARVDLAGDNEVPPVASSASGEVTATLVGDVLTVNGDFSAMETDLMAVSGSAAHIHEGDVDETGPILFNLQVTSADNRSGTVSGTFELTGAQITVFEQGLLYVNVHTVGNPMGEIRGQLIPE